jgi:cbb3-type cytochrome oxidase subunit 3
MWGTVLFAALWAVLTARLFGPRQRQIAEEARALPLADDDGGPR